MDQEKETKHDVSHHHLSEYDICDFCINCNTVLHHESSKISKIFRIVSTNRTIPLSSSTTAHDSEQANIKNKTEVNLLAAISEIFNLENVMDPSEKHSVCGKCGKLLEMAYNAILDFMELTRRGSALQSQMLLRINTRNRQSSSSSLSLRANVEKNGRSTPKNDNNEFVMMSKRSLRSVKNTSPQVQSNLQNVKMKNATNNDDKSTGIKTDLKTESSSSSNSKVKGKYPCSLCSKKFTSEALFKKHNRRFHNNDKKSVSQELRCARPEEKSGDTVTKGGQMQTGKNSDSALNDDLSFIIERDLKFEKEDSFQNPNDEDIEEAENYNSDHGSKTDDDEEDALLDCELSLEKLKCKFCGEGNNSVLELKEHFSKQHPLVSILTVNDIQNIEPNKDAEEAELNGANVKDVVDETEKTAKGSGYNGRFIFNCNVCNKRFIRHDHLKLHLRIHTGEKPYTCKVDGCKKAFSDPRGLAYHEITHSNARPYCCKFCGMTFKRLHHLNDHERNHNDVPRRFNCQYCDKAFKHRKHLNSHLVVHQRTKEHQCNLCFKSFNRKDNLRQHVRNVHEGKTSTVAATTNEGEGSSSSVKSKETTKNAKNNVPIKLVGEDGAFSSTTQTVVFHAPNGIITTGTIITGSGNDSSVIKNSINLQGLTDSSPSTSVVLPTTSAAVVSKSSSNVAGVNIPLAIDQIVYMHL